jgi:hypothetical protein
MELRHLPHKNLIASASIACTILVVGVLLNTDKLSLPQFSQKVSPNTIKDTSLATTDIAVRDSDNDGLMDWEERLRGSDPFHPDTDRDGTFDGNELSSGRDPMKAGPNDILPVVQDPLFATSSTDLAGIKKEFFAEYLSQAGRDVRETTFRTIISEFDAKKFTPTYRLEDLNVTADVSRDALRQYGNAFGVLIQKYTATPLRTEEQILEQAMKVKDDSALKDLGLLIVVYTNFAKDLKAISVPLPLAEHHLAIINGYDAMARGLRGMQVMFSNPIDGSAGYQTYTRQRYNVLIGYMAVVTYFIEQNITFEAQEPGYPFYYQSPKDGAEEQTEEEELLAQ